MQSPQEPSAELNMSTSLTSRTGLLARNNFLLAVIREQSPE